MVKNGALLAAPFATIPVDSTGERGLIGITLHPNFAANGFVYIHATRSALGVRTTASAASPRPATSPPAAAS